MTTRQDGDLGALQCEIDQLTDQLKYSQLIEQHLFKAKEEAELANRSKSEFLANMSHEIRTPLTAILGYAEILMDQSADEECRRAAQTIQQNGKYLLGILDDILNLSKLEAERCEIEPVRCAPMEIVDDVFQLMSVRARAKALKFEIVYEGEIPSSIETDPMRLRQILINLVANAIKFTELGHVKLVIRMNAECPDKIQFQVIDTGIGMNPDQIARVFEPFVQGDASTTRRFGGSGLGLAICRRLSHLLGGDVSAESQLGKGSSFVANIATGSLVDVPMLSSQETNARSLIEIAPTTDKPLLACRVLYAEDGPDNQRIVSFFLRKAGVDVTLAINGLDAVHKTLATHTGFGRRADDPTRPFDVVLMDMQMPVLDGYEATRMIRAQGYIGPIIALTANAMQDDEQKCLDAGCDDFLSKPIDRQTLIDTIAKFTESPSSVNMARPSL